MLRVPTNSRTDAVLAEFGRLPLHVMWHQQILKYLNRIAFLPDHHPVHLAFQVSQKLGKNSWYKRLFTRMKEYNLRMRPLPLEVGAATDTMIDAYFAGLGIKKGEREQTRVWQTYVSTRSPVVIESYKPQRYLVDVRNFHARRMLSRFRLGVTELEINMGTHRKVARAERFCPVCAKLGHPPVVEDELHFALVCPAYSHIRSKYRLFECQPRSLPMLFGPARDMSKLSNFLVECFQHRASALGTVYKDASYH